MSLKIQYLKTRPVGKVTFRLPAAAAPDAASAHLVGEFNDWNEKATPMTRLKDGSFKAVLDLECGNSFSFRYLIDGNRWENDWEAHAYRPHPFGDGDNSVVEL
jgi:1,4-alpha-glucan branching enzyme